MSLHLGSDILHNYVLDSEASTNVMPLNVMRQLELEVHQPYRNVCGLDSRSMLVHGLIKDMVVRLAASPDISTIMDIVVIDLPPSYGMLVVTEVFCEFGWNNSNGSILRIHPKPRGS